MNLERFFEHGCLPISAFFVGVVVELQLFRGGVIAAPAVVGYPFRILLIDELDDRFATSDLVHSIVRELPGHADTVERCSVAVFGQFLGRADFSLR